MASPMLPVSLFHALLVLLLAALCVANDAPSGSQQTLSEIQGKQDSILQRTQALSDSLSRGFTETSSKVQQVGGTVDKTLSTIESNKRALERQNENWAESQKALTEINAQQAQILVQVEALTRNPSKNTDAAQLGQIDQALRALQEKAHASQEQLVQRQRDGEKLAKQVEDVEKLVKDTQGKLKSLQADVSQIKDAIQQLSANEQQREKPDVYALLQEMKSNQLLMFSRLNESSLDLVLANVRAFGTHFKNGGVFLWAQTVQFCTAVFDRVAIWFKEVMQHGATVDLAAAKAEVMRWPDRVWDYLNRRHRQLVTMLQEQKLVTVAQERHAHLAAWGVIGIIGVVGSFIAVWLLQKIVCLVCCCRCGKRNKSKSPTVSAAKKGKHDKKDDKKKSQ